jgi:hypothetical protein
MAAQSSDPSTSVRRAVLLPELSRSFAQEGGNFPHACPLLYSPDWARTLPCHCCFASINRNRYVLHFAEWLKLAIPRSWSGASSRRVWRSWVVSYNLYDHGCAGLFGSGASGRQELAERGNTDNALHGPSRHPLHTPWKMTQLIGYDARFLGKKIQRQYAQLVPKLSYYYYSACRLPPGSPSSLPARLKV